MSRAAAIAVLALIACAKRGSPAAPTEVEVHTVRGASMTGLLEAGQTIRVARGFYANHPIERGDLVVYGTQRPIVKRASAIGGDRFGVTDDHGRLGLTINGKPATTSRGEPYSLDAAGARMLSLYARGYDGTVPPDACLLLSNVPSGGLDSARFGLVARRDLVGKVLR